MTVICHGSDGHISIEAVSHNHCDCSTENELNSEVQDNPSEINIFLSSEHIHCTDTLAVFNLYVIKSINLKSSILKVLNTDSFSSHIKFNNYSLDSYLISNIDNLPDFFIPLQTIILLT
ncbi:MAG: hypothetical protein JXA96_16065 [Sedimentisphaerales bacterium]|nr:hypothetical protein [Sedimentisphaerales bacterium]